MKSFFIVSLIFLASCATNYEDREGFLSDVRSSAEADRDELAMEVAEAKEMAMRTAEAQRLERIQSSNFRAVSNQVPHEAMDSHAGMKSMMGDIPAAAQAGQCFTKVMTPAKYDYKQESVMVQPEAVTYQTQPAKYQWVSKTVTVKEASKKLIAVPATYKYVTSKIRTKDAGTQLVNIPAQYKFVNERVLVSPAREIWKRGEGTHVNENGILCKVKVPAQYKNVQKRIVVREADTLERDIPAEFKYVKKRVVATPATFREMIIPEEKNTIRIKELVSPARKIASTVPAKFQTITKKELVEAPVSKWAPILCKTNATHGKIVQVQKALKLSGYNPGELDGVLGRDTAMAISRFQTKNQLAKGGLTLETLKALNINL